MPRTAQSIILDLLTRNFWYAPHEVRLQLQLAGYFEYRIELERKEAA